MKPIDWDDVRVFLAVRQEGSLSAAARLLKLDQSTAGRRLTALEAALDARLFDRTPEGMVLTPAGESIQEAAAAMEHASMDLARRAGGSDARVEGTVRVATSDAFATYFLCGALARLRTAHPGIDVELAVGASMVDLSRREADLAVRLRPKGMPPAQPDLVARKLTEVAFALYASRAYVVRLGLPDPEASGLSGHDLVGYDPDLPPVPGVSWLSEHAAGARTVVRCGSFMSMTAAVIAGLGAAVLPCFIGDAQQTLQRASGAVAWSDCWLVVHPDLRNVARVRAVWEVLADAITSHEAAFRGVSPNAVVG